MIHKPMITDAVNRSQIYSHFNKELRQVFIAITRVWCRKSFPSLFEMTIRFSAPNISNSNFHVSIQHLVVLHSNGKI